MIFRVKGGEYRAGSVPVLLEFLGVRKDAAGIHVVKNDVELVAAVQMSNEQ